jgi:hypothetical protein
VTAQEVRDSAHVLRVADGGRDWFSVEDPCAPRMVCVHFSVAAVYVHGSHATVCL